MPPRLYSRHSFTTQLKLTESNITYLTDREKYLYRELPDNISHPVEEGDSWQSIAARYYSALSDPPRFSAAQLWTVVADFQPQPTHDPTIVLVVGSSVIVPSLRTVVDQIYNPNDREDQGGRR